MTLKVNDVRNIMESYAPPFLKESYDNVGLMVGETEAEITSILVSLDCTLKVIDEAMDKGCNLILTHHPLLFHKPSAITSETLLGKKLLKIIRNNINVYSCHTNLDSVKDGINDIIVRKLGLGEGEIIGKNTDEFRGYTSGIGRLVNIEKGILLSELLDRVKEVYSLTNISFCGDDNKKVYKIALINGSGSSYFKEAVDADADCIITGDTTYHYISDMAEEGIAVIDAGHYGTEWPAMKDIADFLRNKLTFLGFQNEVFLSESNNNPYRYI